MANRDVGISICGVVVGVMLGAGSVLYTQDAPLHASATQVAAYFGNVDTDAARARNVEAAQEEQAQADALREKAATVKEVAPAEHKAAPALDLSACGVAKAIAARLNAAVDAVIPVQQDRANGAAQSSALHAIAANVVTDYCGTASMQSAPASTTDTPFVKPEKQVDNDCEQYLAGSTRRTICEGNQLQGKTYIGY